MSRMNVEFTPATDAALERLAETLGTSKAGILRFGIALMQIAVREQASGNSIGVVNGQQVVREVVGVWSIPAGQKERA